jgi:hypothetical protein
VSQVGLLGTYVPRRNRRASAIRRYLRHRFQCSFRRYHDVPEERLHGLIVSRRQRIASTDERRVGRKIGCLG